ncbi:MAG: ABC transporter permease subunit [Xanthobacteraceae bacterium]
MKTRQLDTVLLLLCLGFGWELVYVLVGADVAPSPMTTLERAGGLLQTANFWKDAASTGRAFGLACAIGITSGILIGLLLGFSRLASEVADPMLGTIYSIPKITLYPIILLMFGLSLSAKVAFGVIHGVFPVIIATMSALRNVAPIHRRTAQVLGLTPAATVATILVPAALPEIFSGIRIGVAVTLLGTLLAEMFASASGLGFALIRAMELHTIVDIFALALLIFTAAAILNGSLLALERRLRGHG